MPYSKPVNMGKRNAQAVTGAAISRFEARDKVSGKAKYAADYKPNALSYGVLVTSTITRGSIVSIDTKKAGNMPGVITVITHLNRPTIPGWDTPPADKSPGRVEGQEFRIFFNNRIYYHHQPVALVIADTWEKAIDAARFITVTYNKEPHHTNLHGSRTSAIRPKREKGYARGIAKAFEQAAIKIDAVYTTPFQVHHPMEMHAATSSWVNGHLEHFNKTQATKMARQDIVKTFSVTPENVHVHSPFVGGAFGSSSRIWPPEMAALIGSMATGRPLTVMATREQVFNMVGYRPASEQRVAIGASAEGRITGISHWALGSTSSYEEFTERITDVSRALYAADNMDTEYRLVPLDMSTPCWTRGPGETSGSFALESAMDELAWALKMDPLAFRLKNFAETDPELNLPWSTNYLRDCYEQGAKAVGWWQRNPLPGSMREGEWLKGMGMSAGIYKAGRSTASASAALHADGTLMIKSSVADTGPGSATALTQIAADAAGIDVSRVLIEWGDSNLPEAPGQFGSHTTASVGTAVYEAVKGLYEKIKLLAVQTPLSAFNGQAATDLGIENGSIQSKRDGSAVSLTAVLDQAGLKLIDYTHTSKATEGKPLFSSKSFCAHFVEVLVHPHTGVIKVKRVVTAVDAGTIINKKTATNQVYGSVAWGVGIALMEEGIIDERYGRYINSNLADYHLPVHTDMPQVEVIFIDKPDTLLDPMGTKGLGEIGLVGLTGAIANAVYHATGKRIRSLPITGDKLL
jgi:xanthine dehydrogenase YagR molybdenum-binding subunit